MKKKVKSFCEVEIPHLWHKVVFLDISQLRGVEIKGSAFTAVQDEHTTLVFIEDIENTVKDIERMPEVAHELVHVLQILNEKISAQFENEQEHMGYLMSYMLKKLISHVDK